MSNMSDYPIVEYAIKLSALAKEIAKLPKKVKKPEASDV